MMYRLMVLLIGLMVGASCFAELKLPAVFSDGMVLQRDQKVAVWGWANPGTEVTVLFAGQEKKGKASADGTFLVRLDKMKASADPRSLKVVSGAESAEVKNVLVGEVWLCSGQSNMQWPVKQSMNFEKEKEAAKYPLIRMFQVKRKVSLKPLDDCTGSWYVCSPETVGEFSATAYFFGREIHQKLGVPVGLVHSSWGGTRIESWSRMASLEQFPAVMKYKSELDEKAAAFDQAVVDAEHAKKMEAWKKRQASLKAEGKEPKKGRQPKKKQHPHRSQNYPPGSNLVSG
jgi:sialate O-acetylesterase